MTTPLAVGDVIHGFANGAFGRDHYDCTKIEAVGPDWIVCRNETGEAEFVWGRKSLELCQANRKPTTDSYDNPCCNAGTAPLTTWKPE